MRSPSDLHPLSIRIGSELSEIPPGPIWVACSGGLDSSVLAALAVPAIQAQGRPAGLLYVDHGQHERSKEAAEAVRRLARRLGAESRTFPGSGLGDDASEERLRGLRYVIFRRIAQERCLKALLLAHHQDDQIETVLFRLRRGPGVRGLAGIPRSREITSDCLVLRPLLDIRRHDLEAVARDLDLQWVEDPTNDDLGFARNEIRHVELPRLRARYPGLDERLLALAERRSRRNHLLASKRGDLEPRITRYHEGRVWIDGATLLQQTPALREELLEFVACWFLKRPVQRRLVRRLAALACAAPGTLVDDTGGLLGEKRGDNLLLTTREALGSAPETVHYLLPDVTEVFGSTEWIVRNRTSSILRLRTRGNDGTPESPGLRRRLRSLAGRLDRERVPLIVQPDGSLEDVISSHAEVEVVQRPALHFGDRPQGD